MLELDGVVVGRVSAEGGGAFAEVVVTPPPGSGWVQKHVGGVRYDHILIACGAGMAPVFYAWIRATLNGEPLRKSGAIIQTTYDGKELARLQFFDARIGGIHFPELDASSKTSAKMSVRIVPETTQWLPGSGAVVSTVGLGQSGKQWLASNFRLEIIGLDCSKVTRIAPLEIKASPGESALSEPLAVSETAVRLEAGNLVIMLPAIAESSFRYWHEEFVVLGKNASDKEKMGSIQLLAPDGVETVLVLNLEGLGIVKLARIAPAEAGEDPSRVRAEMYCNRITLDQGALAAASATGGSKALAVESPSRLGPRGVSDVARNQPVRGS